MLIVVIPSRNAEAGLSRLLPQLDGVSTVVADGGSEDATLAVALKHGARIALGASGRGQQLRLGAHLAGLAGASDDWFLILHADCRLPGDWRSVVKTAMTEGDPRYFRFRADAVGLRARFMDVMVALRCRLFGLPYGDQGLLVSRELYEQVGGYAPVPLFEDVGLVDRLQNAARLRPLPVALTTDVSGHWRDGLFRRGLRNLHLLWRYRRGADVQELLRDYSA